MTVKHRRTLRTDSQTHTAGSPSVRRPAFLATLQRTLTTDYLLRYSLSVYLTLPGILGGRCTASLQVEVGMDRPTGNRLLTTRLLTADC